ncbi:signal recognition particle, SRP19 subunit [Gautieria morchelliformis]|nr:signal recognition particle, SRP19 subunit [Gautieria morchelliformis]
MSRRAVIEEVDDTEFNDDTDLPLPRLPNTGSQGPLLQELNLNEPFSRPPGAPPSRPQDQQQQSQGETSASGENITVDPITGKKTIWIQDGSAYKMWTSVYPIYLDAKRPYSGSERRIAREKCIWWPLSTDIVDACGRLGLKTLHEPGKQHPRDWENPGRVKVCFKVDGRIQHSHIKTKKQLLEAIAHNMQQQHPDLVPRPVTDNANTPIYNPPPQTGTDVKLSSNKKDKAKTSSALRTAPSPISKTKSRMPQPPWDALRVSQFSPAQEANILIETVKAGMNAPVPGEGAPGGQAAVGGKGKRKVVRLLREYGGGLNPYASMATFTVFSFI